ncbi:hypothetical protein ES707_13279 [subsurface metagenome]
MSKNLSWRKTLGLVIIILCLLSLLVQSNLYSPSFSDTSWEGATLSIVAGGGIVLGSYLVLGPVGILVSLVALIAGGCNGGGGGGDGKDLGEPPNPPN